MKTFLLMITVLASCVNDTTTEPPEGRQQQAVYTCGGGQFPVTCDGPWSEGDFWCNWVCRSQGEVGGYCVHPNPNDAYHGYCVGGAIPVVDPGL